MKTINDIQKNLSIFDNYARNASKQIDPETNIQTKWKTLFDNTMPTGSAKSFVKYYRDMRSKKQLQNGGGNMHYEPAPLKYEMVPGLNTAVYARLPVAVNSDADSIRNLDVYFNNSITKGCGIENSSLSITEGMGSNKVGGSRKYRSISKSLRRKTKNNRKNNRKSINNRKQSLKRKFTRRNASQRGGFYPSDIADSLLTRMPPNASSVPPNFAQTTSMNVNGSTSVIPSPSPSSHSFQYVNPDINTILNPGKISVIDDQFSLLLKPAGLPWGQNTGQPQVPGTVALDYANQAVGAFVNNKPIPPPPEAVVNLAKGAMTNPDAIAYTKSVLGAVVDHKPIPAPPASFEPLAKQAMTVMGNMKQ